MKLKRTCKNKCKKYRAKKPVSGGRYEAGQGKCQTCDTWISYRGAHLKNGSPAKIGSVGWFCNCCNFRIRQNPRSRIYKEKYRMRQTSEIPKYHDIMPPILEICSDTKQHSIRELVDAVADRFRLTDNARRQILRRNETILYNRTSWALTYLRKAGLIESYNGFVSITRQGHDVLQSKPDKIDKEFLMKIPKFVDFYKSTKTDDKKQPHTVEQDDNLPQTNNTYMDKLNQLIADAFRLIKYSPNGAYTEDLKVLLGISTEEMSGIATRLKRIEGMTISEIHRSTRPFDFLFTYKESIVTAVQEPDKQYTKEETTTDVKIKDVPDDLVKNMLEEYNEAKKTIDKSLQKELTLEFIHTGSVKSVMEQHPNIPKGMIRRHIRTPMRLPDMLRARNEEGLHTDPQLSLQIALYAVDLYDWDGNNDDVEDILQTAELIAKHLNTLGHAGKSEVTGHLQQKTITPPADPVPAAIAVWIATATMQKEYGMDAVFSASDIIRKIKEQNLCNVSHGNIQTHVSSHCVANVPTTHKNDHRKIYRVGSGRYRLYKRAEYYHPTREGFKIAPLPFQIPPEYRDLRRWYDEEYCTQS